MNIIEYHNLNCLNEFSGCVDYAEAKDKVKTSRNDSSDLKSESYTPNGDVSNGANGVFTFISEGGVTINVYDACSNGTCTCSHVIGGEPAQLKPCRFLYLYSIATEDGKTHFSSPMSCIVDGVKVMDGSQETANLNYNCKNYKSIFEGNKKSKLDKI